MRYFNIGYFHRLSNETYDVATEKYLLIVLLIVTILLVVFKKVLNCSENNDVYIRYQL